MKAAKPVSTPKPITELEIISTARDLLSDKARWTQKAFARDLEGHSIPWSDPAAQCWCLFGAVSHAGQLLGTFNDSNNAVIRSVLSLEQVAGMGATVFNDTATHDDVIQLLDRTMELLP